MIISFISNYSPRNSQVKQDQEFTFTASHLLPNIPYQLRIGPHDTFFRDYTPLSPQTSDAQGIITVTIAIPERAQNTEVIMLRLDGDGTYVSGSFANKDGGTTLSPSELVRLINCTMLQTPPRFER